MNPGFRFALRLTSGMVRAVVIVLSTVLAAGCWQPDNPLDPRSPSFSGTPLLKVETVKVRAEKLLMEKNEKLAAAALVTFEDKSVLDLTARCAWKSGNTGVAIVSDAEGSKGMITAVGQGTALITAVYNGVSSEGDNAFLLTVPGPHLASITVKPDVLATEQGQTVNFTATGTYSDGLELDLTKIVTWSATGVNGSGLTVAVVLPAPSPEGSVRCEQAGVSEVKAVYSGVTGNIVTLTVKEPVLVEVSVQPGSRAVPKGLNAAFTATGTYGNGFTKDLTSEAVWAVSSEVPANAANVPVASSQGAGIFLCDNPGTAVITVSIPGTTGVTVHTADLTVTNRVLQRIVIARRPPALNNEGATAEFTATGYFSDSTAGEDVTQNILWKSSAADAAAFDGFSAGAALLRIKTGGSGSPVTVTAEASAIVSENSVSFTIAAPVATGISITPSVSTVNYDGQLTFTVTASMSAGAGTNVTAAAAWNLAGQNVITGIAADGTATINQAEILGSPGGIPGVTVSASYAGFSASVSVDFIPVPVLVRIDPEEDTVPLGNPANLTRTFRAFASFRRSDNTVTEREVTQYASWNSSNAAVAEPVTGAGNEGKVLAKTAGSAQISAAYGTFSSDAWGRSASLSVTDPVPVSNLGVTLSAPTVVKGRTIQARAQATYTDGSTRDVTGLATWSTGNPAAVFLDRNTIESGGYLTVRGDTANPAVTITAALAGLSSASANIAVGPPETVGITVVPDNSVLIFGSVMSVKVSAGLSDGTSIDVTGSAAWTFVPAGVLAIDASGNTSVTLPAVLPAGGFDTIAVTASYNPAGTAFQASKAIEIKYNPIVIEVAPPAVGVITGNVQDFTATAFFLDEGGSVASRTVTGSADWTSGDADVAEAVAGTPGRFRAVGSVGLSTSVIASYGPASSNQKGGINGTLTVDP